MFKLGYRICHAKCVSAFVYTYSQLAKCPAVLNAIECSLYYHPRLQSIHFHFMCKQCYCEILYADSQVSYVHLPFWGNFEKKVFWQLLECINTGLNIAA